MKDFGVTIRKGKGSHTVYEYPKQKFRIVVASHQPHIKEYIVKQALEAIDKIKGSQAVEDESDDENS